MEKPATPISEPIAPHSVKKAYTNRETNKPNPTNANHQVLQAIAHQSKPMVVEIPLPPLNLEVTGKTCPKTAKRAKK